MAGLHYNDQNLSGANGLVPRGVIAIWSGPTTNIPTGWALCDGQSGTPDLRDRFVVGAGSGYAVGAMGGQATTQHSHTYNFPTAYTSVGGEVVDSYGQPGSYANHHHTISGTTPTATLENRPPFYALAFIMKL